MGYRAVRVDWKDLDRCGVCDMDEVNHFFMLLWFFLYVTFF